MVEEITIGKIIKQCRLQSGLSQAELSDGICSARYVSKLESGNAIPTIDIVSRFSAKLGINIYEEFALVLSHHTLDAHLKIQEINEYLSASNIKNILPVLEELESNKDFQAGEPFQVYSYAKACYLSHVEKNIYESLRISLAAINSNYTNIEELTTKKYSFTNIELCLLLHIACEYHRVSQNEKSILYFEIIITNVLHILQTEKKSIINTKKHFYLSFIGKSLYMFYLAYPSTACKKINDYYAAILVLKKYKTVENLPELLYIYSIMLYKLGLFNESDLYKQNSKALGLIMNNQKYVDDFINNLEKNEYNQR